MTISPLPTESFTVPLVGMYFRPPASSILSVLPAGTPLYLSREPENPYDENAVMVAVHTSDIPENSHEHLGELSAPFGFDLAEILNQPSWHLGYVARDFAVHLSPLLLPDPTYSATLAFPSTDAKGKPKPAVIIQFETEE